MLQIGSVQLPNWLVMAPMAGYTNLPFRLMIKRLGVGLTTTEMISAKGLILRQKRSFNYLTTHPSEGAFAAQLFGSEPEIMAAAAEIAVDSGAAIVDINMGCPVKKVLKTGAGGALLREPKKAAQLASAVKRACSCPVTAKIRAGWSPTQWNAGRLGRLLEDCGVDAITIHARFLTQRFQGKADWALIADLKEKVGIPVIGNGDILHAHDALEMKRTTGCDGVMIGRGALTRPWIFSEIQEIEAGRPVSKPSLEARKHLIMDHYRLLVQYEGEPRASRSIRGLLFRYTKGLPFGARFRESISGVKDSNSLLEAVEGYFADLQGEWP